MLWLASVGPESDDDCNLPHRFKRFSTHSILTHKYRIFSIFEKLLDNISIKIGKLQNRWRKCGWSGSGLEDDSPVFLVCRLSTHIHAPTLALASSLTLSAASLASVDTHLCPILLSNGYVASRVSPSISTTDFHECHNHCHLLSIGNVWPLLSSPTRVRSDACRLPRSFWIRASGSCTTPYWTVKSVKSNPFARL